jgi:hypothetical protein
MVRPRGNALRLPGAAKLLRAASGQIAFGFLKTDAQSAQRLDQAKFQINAVATKRIFF